MYESDEEISSKRRFLLFIITIVILAIIALIGFLVYRAISKNNSGKKKELTCELEVAGNPQQRANGTYTEEVEVVFKKTTLVSDKYQLIKKNVGITDVSDNTDSYRISTTGQYIVHGYLLDSNGNEGECELTVKVELSKPTCELQVVEGDMGDNGWYTSNARVAFSSLETNNPNTSIEKYYIEKSDDPVNPSTDNIDSYLVTQDGTVDLVGHVTDSTGKTGTCTITVKQDTKAPTCSLKVQSGTLDGNAYTDSPTIGFDATNDTTSGIKDKGVGVTKNYTDQTYTLNEFGTFSIYGYVKDNAGNEATCSIPVTKKDPNQQGGGGQGGGGQGGGGQGGGGGPIIIEPEPRCLLYIVASPVDPSNYKYALYQDGNRKIVKVVMTVSANTTAYGIGTSETFNGQTEYIITKPGTYVISGFVSNSQGTKYVCSTPQFTVYNP